MLRVTRKAVRTAAAAANLAVFTVVIGCGPVDGMNTATTANSDGKADSPTSTDTSASRHVVFVNFDGVTIEKAASDDARQNRSQIGATTIAPFDHAPLAPNVDRATAIRTVVDRLRTYYKGLDVQFVTARPKTGAYTMLVVGGTGDQLNRAGYGGVSPIDCTNQNANNIAFVFSGSLSRRDDGLVGVAALGAHELGHAFGLEHTDNPLDIMYSSAASVRTYGDVFELTFSTGDYSDVNVGTGGTKEACGRPDPLDNAAILETNLGRVTAETAAAGEPSVTFTQMSPDGSAAPTSTPSIGVAVDATSPTGIAHVEVYKNYELVAVLTAPPYSLTLPSRSGETAYLAAEAVDMSGRRSAVTGKVSVE